MHHAGRSLGHRGGERKMAAENLRRSEFVVGALRG
jgi:hypothetical protein